MIRSPHRFHGHHSLSVVYQRSQTVRSPALLLRFVPRRRSCYRAAVVVSRKVHKSAVRRNRIRRRIYALLQAYEAQLAPYDMVFVALHDHLADMAPSELQATVHGLLKRAGIIDPAQKPAGHGIVKPAKRKS